MTDPIKFVKGSITNGDIETLAFHDVYVEREDIVLVERDEYFPEYELVVHTLDGRHFSYPLTEEGEEVTPEKAEEEEWLLAFEVSHDYAPI